MKPDESHDRIRQSAWAMALSAALAACIPVPQPSAPRGVEMVVGADHTANAFGHWACPETDVIVANVDGQWLIHELTVDYVVKKSTVENDQRVFSMVVGGSRFVYRVPTNATDPLVVVSGTYGHEVQTTCPVAPAVTFLGRGPK